MQRVYKHAYFLRPSGLRRKFHAIETWAELAKPLSKIFRARRSVYNVCWRNMQRCWKDAHACERTSVCVWASPPERAPEVGLREKRVKYANESGAGISGWLLADSTTSQRGSSQHIERETSGRLYCQHHSLFISFWRVIYGGLQLGELTPASPTWYSLCSGGDGDSAAERVTGGFSPRAA